MKKLSLFILLSAVTIISCNDDPILTVDENVVDEPATRALSIDQPSISNPTLHDDWENVSTIYLNGGTSSISAPWVNEEGGSNIIPLNYREDIKKEDGWIMLSHTILDQSSAEPNYILLYNKKRGIVKGFYYNPINIMNPTFMWVLEADQPTSVFPPNDLIFGPVNTTSQYTTSSNISSDSPYNFGGLQQGWNAFSFELPYGSINNSPVVTIKGYNDLLTEVILNGDYSGEVIIPVPREDSSGLSSFLSSMKGLFGVASKIIPALSTVEEAVGVVGAVLGQTSLGKSEAGVTNIRATASGKINLTGTSFAQFTGAATPIGNITLRRLNGNTDLGLWNLSETPTYNYDKYTRLFLKPNSGSTYLGTVRVSGNIVSKIVVNPEVSNQISNIEVVNTQFFYKDRNTSLDFSTEEIEGRYFTDFEFQRYSDILIEPGKFYIFFANAPAPIQASVNIVVKFTFNDGSTFLSSRNFETRFNMVDNSDEVEFWENKATVVIL